MVVLHLYTVIFRCKLFLVTTRVEKLSQLQVTTQLRRNTMVTQKTHGNSRDTLPETNSWTLKIGHPKRKRVLVFQPSIFRGKLAVSFRECTIPSFDVIKVCHFDFEPRSYMFYRLLSWRGGRSCYGYHRVYPASPHGFSLAKTGVLSIQARYLGGDHAYITCSPFQKAGKPGNC